MFPYITKSIIIVNNKKRWPGPPPPAQCGRKANPIYVVSAAYQFGAPTYTNRVLYLSINASARLALRFPPTSFKEWEAAPIVCVWGEAGPCKQPRTHATQPSRVRMDGGEEERARQQCSEGSRLSELLVLFCRSLRCVSNATAVSHPLAVGCYVIHTYLHECVNRSEQLVLLFCRSLRCISNTK